MQLPELPGILGSRRHSTAHSPDVSEPLDLLIKGEARKKSQTQVSLDVVEEPSVIAPEEVISFSNNSHRATSSPRKGCQSTKKFLRIFSRKI